MWGWNYYKLQNAYRYICSSCAVRTEGPRLCINVTIVWCRVYLSFISVNMLCIDTVESADLFYVGAYFCLCFISCGKTICKVNLCYKICSFCLTVITTWRENGWEGWVPVYNWKDYSWEDKSGSWHTGCMVWGTVHMDRRSLGRGQENFGHVILFVLSIRHIRHKEI